MASTVLFAHLEARDPLRLHVQDAELRHVEVDDSRQRADAGELRRRAVRLRDLVALRDHADAERPLVAQAALVISM